MVEAAVSKETFSPNLQVAKDMADFSGEAINSCYQCLKCSAGCPMAVHTEMGPSKVMRYLQLGLVDEVLASKSIWMCLSCNTCSVRCPNDIDVAHVMDTARHEAIKRGIDSPKEKIQKFHELFLKSIRRHGRTFESGFAATFLLKQGGLFKYMGQGMSMFFKGKMPMFPSRISGRKAIKKIFKRSKEKKKEE